MNDGPEGFSNYAAAKNSLSVGAVFDDGAVAPFSGHGPTGDGRLAPQVLATGVGVCSPEGNGTGAGYACLHGTSMAAPYVAGVAALLLDANPDYKNQLALARARLMASAIRPDAWLGHADAVPLTNTGGPGNLEAQYGLGKVSARLAVLDRDQADGWAGGGAVAVFEDESEYAYSDIEGPEGASRLDVVLTWDEPPTEAIATPVLKTSTSGSTGTPTATMARAGAVLGIAHRQRRVDRRAIPRAGHVPGQGGAAPHPYGAAEGGHLLDVDPGSVHA